MKKFLCYDTNDAVSERVNVDSRGMLRPNATVPSTNGTPYQQLVTDGEGGVKWEDRLAYEVTGWKDFTLNSLQTEITGFTMPPVGDTVTVKVNGVESVETVTLFSVGDASDAFHGRYIGSHPPFDVVAGAPGWCIFCSDGVEEIVGAANVPITISLLITEQHKIDEKYIQQDKNFVRPLSYYIDGSRIFKHYYKESGEEVSTYKCDNIETKSAHGNTVFVYDIGGDTGMGYFMSVTPKAFFVSIYTFSTSGIHNVDKIYGTDETAIAELAAEEGYTLTTKPII